MQTDAIVSPTLKQVKSEARSWKPTTNSLTSFFLIPFLLSSFVSFSQTTEIPDANFEQNLIDLGIDTNGKNGNTLNSDAVTVTSLNVPRRGIANLVGIEAFTALTFLL